MGLFDCTCAVRGTVRVWLLGPIFIWGVRKAKVQIPIHWLVDISKHLSHKPRKGLDGGGTILCLWEDEWATHLLQFDYFRPWLNWLQLQFFIICKLSGAFWANSMALKTSPFKGGSIRVPMAVAIFHGTSVAKYRGAPKDKQSLQSLASWGLVSFRRWWVALRTWYRRRSKGGLTL